MLYLKEQKIKKYREGIMNFGFLSLCYLIDVYEKEENYEECEIIKQAIDDQNKQYNLDLPTSYKDGVEYFKNVIGDFGLTGEIIMKNLPLYSEKIQQEIKKIKFKN